MIRSLNSPVGSLSWLQRRNARQESYSSSYGDDRSWVDLTGQLSLASLRAGRRRPVSYLEVQEGDPRIRLFHLPPSARVRQLDVASQCEFVNFSVDNFSELFQVYGEMAVNTISTTAAKKLYVL